MVFDISVGRGVHLANIHNWERFFGYVFIDFQNVKESDRVKIVDYYV